MTALTTEQLMTMMAEMQLKIQAMENEKVAAAAEAKAAADRKAAAEKNGGYVDGIHHFGFPCLVPIDADLTSPFHKFKVTSDTVVLKNADTSADGKTTWGPELLYFPANKVLSWSAGGPKNPLSTGNYISAGSGSSSSKYDPETGIGGTQIGTLLALITAGHADRNVFIFGNLVCSDRDEFLKMSVSMLEDWFSSLNQGKQTRRRFQPR